MFKLVTDNTADLPSEYLKEHNVDYMVLSYIVDGVAYGKEKELDWKEFYAMMRDGKMPTTWEVVGIRSEERRVGKECGS